MYKLLQIDQRKCQRLSADKQDNSKYGLYFTHGPSLLLLPIVSHCQNKKNAQYEWMRQNWHRFENNNIGPMWQIWHTQKDKHKYDCVNYIQFYLLPIWTQRPY